ncbi:glyoxylase-like metal-dependent hydrolase (beta-lactamase superfamily II) [Desulfomicrobium macestii]|uniref:Glyoxylase-like metal-dependent hydrolase (Beta-lactamase superfamily II) n=1 Tax=Desulfomicrobium macestii TaxID=90731 RepID=A0ABR9GYX8_9BACT|nr:MBL fold metallo-hydrolase [Desulfomicrobium macestii]MBE1423639.1 glyoxylase-like metal-dependent hydrolase (beta-lactamase superfamily II) [Desulfomicrobium macestii]
MSHFSAIHEIDAGDFSVRSVLIRGTRFCLIWDTLTSPRDMASFAQICAGQQCLAVYSHADWDHVQGTAALDNPVVIGHSDCARRFEVEAGQTLADMQAREPGRWDEVKLIPPHITFEGRLDLDLGGLTVQLHSLPGHTPDTLVAFIPEMELLLAGDAVELPLPCVPAGCDLDAWIGELLRWRKHPGACRIIPSHGPMGGKDILDGTIDYLDGLRQGQNRLLPEGLSPFYASTHRDNLSNRGIGTGS